MSDGPAFPIMRLDGIVEDGLWLRDYFAAKAMAAMCGGQWPTADDRREIAKRAFAMADAMLEEREA